MAKGNQARSTPTGKVAVLSKKAVDNFIDWTGRGLHPSRNLAADLVSSSVLMTRPASAVASSRR
jgi:hypothetical protein